MKISQTDHDQSLIMYSLLGLVLLIVIKKLKDSNEKERLTKKILDSIKYILYFMKNFIKKNKLW